MHSGSTAGLLSPFVPQSKPRLLYSPVTFVCLAYSAVGSLEGASVGFTCLLEMGSHSVTGTRCVDQAHLKLTEIYLPVPPRTGINPAVL